MSVRESWLRIEDAIPFVRETAEPAIGDIAGSLGLCMLVDQRHPHCVLVSGWESLDAMRASDAAVAPLRTQAQRLLGGDAVVEEWEVAVLRRPLPTGPGNWVGLTRLQGDPDAVDRVVDVYRDQLLPEVQRLSGFRGAMLLVNRADGRAACATTYRGYKELHDARKHWREADRLTAAGVPVRTGDASDLQVELAGMRLPEVL